MNDPTRPIRKLPPTQPRPSLTPWEPQVTYTPSSKGGERARRICNSKHHYQDQQDALAEACRVHHHVYLCGLCGTWHLTSPRPAQPAQGSQEVHVHPV